MCIRDSLRVVKVAAHRIIFIKDHIAALAGVQINDPGKQAHLVVQIQAAPHIVGKIANGARTGKAQRLTFKAGDGVAVVLVGADEVTLACNRPVSYTHLACRPV